MCLTPHIENIIPKIICTASVVQLFPNCPPGKGESLNMESEKPKRLQALDDSKYQLTFKCRDKTWVTVQSNHQHPKRGICLTVSTFFENT